LVVVVSDVTTQSVFVLFGQYPGVHWNVQTPAEQAGPPFPFRGGAHWLAQDPQLFGSVDVETGKHAFAAAGLGHCPLAQVFQYVSTHSPTTVVPPENARADTL